MARDRPLKILFCSDYVSTWDIGGATRVLNHQIAAMGDSGVDCRLLSGVPEGESGSLGLPWYRVHYKSLFYIPRLFWWCFWLRWFYRPDVVHIHQPLIGWCAHLALPRSVKRIYHFHSYWGLEKKSHANGFRDRCLCALKSWLELQLLRRMSHFVVLSEYSKAMLRPVCHEGAHINVIPAAVKVHGLNKRSPENGTFKWLSVRRLDPRMGLDVLLEALATLKATDWTLTIVGTGREEKKLRTLCESLKLSKRVTFAGRVSDSELRDLWCGHHGMVIPTREMEGFGLSVIEAWAAGLPVLATKVGALGEFSRHGTVIHLVDECRVEALANGLKWCQSHWLQGDSVSLDCQRVVDDHYDWKRVGVEYYELYRSLT